MSDAVAQFHAALGPYGGYLIAAGTFGAILLLNQLIFRHCWESYPTLAQYSADHPDCIRGGGVVCDKCGTKAARAGVSGRGDIYRCSWCEDELFRIDHKVEGEGVR
jgi:hypothetical protein